MTNEAKKKLSGKTLEELQQICTAEKLPGYTADQIARWIYKKNISEIDAMTNLSLKSRNALKEKYTIGKERYIDVQTSADGTKKYLFQTDHEFIEAAYIPTSTRATLCVSSQAGCRYGCTFCMTGRQGLRKQLTVNQVLNQIQSIDETEKLTNIVFMGMGEPFDNIETVLQTIRILTADYGFAWSPGRITVSTNGLIDGIRRFLKESTCRLAISIHSPFHEQRAEIMPIEKKNPIAEIIALLKQHRWNNNRRLSFEYIVFKNFNDSDAHAKKLAQLLKGMQVRINLIPFHPIPGSPLQACTLKEIQIFQSKLKKNGLSATIRTSRGEDIQAACGLLSTKERQKTSP